MRESKPWSLAEKISIPVTLVVAALGAILTAAAIRYSTDTALWDFVLWGAIAMLFGSLACLALIILSHFSGRSFAMSAVLVFVGIGFIVAGVGWYFRSAAAPSLIPPPLKRMIAYGRLDLATQFSGSTLTLSGYNIGINNVGGDTITSQSMFVRGYFDDTLVMWDDNPNKPQILPQTMGYIISLKRETPINVPPDTKDIIVEFEIDYDTIPETGVRKSYRKIAYPLNWANGRNSAPLVEANIIDQWEK
jgi:hypothetical protein